MKNSILGNTIPLFSRILIFLSLFLTAQTSLQGQTVISQLWSNFDGAYSGTFGAPTTTDDSDLLYRAGRLLNDSSGYDAQLQKLDGDGLVTWDLKINTSSSDIFEPSKVISHDNFLYVTGIVTYASSGESDFWVARIKNNGDLKWLEIDSTSGNDATLDLTFDASNNRVYMCGSTDRNSDYDMLLAAYDTNGNQQWLSTKDYNGNIEVGAKVYLDNGDLFVHGSSQSSLTNWDIVSWEYTTAGVFTSEERGTGLTAANEELKDATIKNGYMNLVGTSSNDFKVVCLDANNNALWSDTYDKNSLADEGSSIVATTNGFVAAGFVTAATGNENIFVRKYNLSGTVLWTREIDQNGANDRAIDVVEDTAGNFLVLTEVSKLGQKDVHLYCLDGTNGTIDWDEAISTDVNLDEDAISLEATFDNTIYVSYSVVGQTFTDAISYDSTSFSSGGEDLSTHIMYIQNQGQIVDTNEQSVMDIKFYSFGTYPDHYFANDYFSNVVAKKDTNGPDSIQRVDYTFVNASEINVGYVDEHKLPTIFNYYHGAAEYEKQLTSRVIAYPRLYESIDGFMSSNSEGFKMTFVLEEGSDIADLQIKVTGATSVSMNGVDFEIETFQSVVKWLDPFSYNAEAEEIEDDECVDFYLDDDILKFDFTCQEMSYPYVIQVKYGVGQSVGASTIDNIEYSTFWGGNFDDGATSVKADSDGNLFVGGYTSSTVFPPITNVTTNSTAVLKKALLFMIDHDAVMQWGTVYKPLNSVDHAPSAGTAIIKDMELFEISSQFPGDEILVVGECVGKFLGKMHPMFNPNTAYMQPPKDINGPDTEIFFGTIEPFSGSFIHRSTFGGAGRDVVYGCELDPDNQIFYLFGATWSDPGTQSQNAPATHTFPIFDPGDGSYFDAVRGTGSSSNSAGFVAAFNLTSKAYNLSYSSYINRPNPLNTNSYRAITDMKYNPRGGDPQVGAVMAYTGWANPPTIARVSFWFDPNGGTTSLLNTVFTPNLDDNNTLSFPAKSYFSSIAINRNEATVGFVSLGMDNNNANDPLRVGTPLSAQTYVGTQKEAYIFRSADHGPPVERFDTQFGTSTNPGVNDTQKPIWDAAMQSIYNLNNIEFKGGAGEVVYNEPLNTYFVGGSVMKEAVPTRAKANFFHESSISSVLTNPESDYYIAAFTHIEYDPVKNPGVQFEQFDVLSWSTVFGGSDEATDDPNHGGKELFGGLTTYEVTTAGVSEQYLAVVGTSFSNSGSTVSDVEKLPVARTPKWDQSTIPWTPLDFYRGNNNSAATGSSAITITRFKVSGIDENISIQEEQTVLSQKSISLFPVPSEDFLMVRSEEESLESIEIFSITGAKVLGFENDKDDVRKEVKLNLANFVPGIYVIYINNEEGAKIIKR